MRSARGMPARTSAWTPWGGSTTWGLNTPWGTSWASPCPRTERWVGIAFWAVFCPAPLEGTWAGSPPWSASWPTPRTATEGCEAQSTYRTWKPVTKNVLKTGFIIPWFSRELNLCCWLSKSLATCWQLEVRQQSYGNHLNFRIINNILKHLWFPLPYAH